MRRRLELPSISGCSWFEVLWFTRLWPGPHYQLTPRRRLEPTHSGEVPCSRGNCLQAWCARVLQMFHQRGSDCWVAFVNHRQAIGPTCPMGRPAGAECDPGLPVTLATSRCPLSPYPNPEGWRVRSNSDTATCPDHASWQMVPPPRDQHIAMSSWPSPQHSGPRGAKLPARRQPVGSVSARSDVLQRLSSRTSGRAGIPPDMCRFVLFLGHSLQDVADGRSNACRVP